MTADGPDDRGDPGDRDDPSDRNERNDTDETNERHEHEMDGRNDMDHIDEPTDRLAVLLTAASDAADAAHGAPVADADDLGRRIRARAARRTRVAGVAAVVLLVAAGAGGFLIGRGAGDGGSDGGAVLASAPEEVTTDDASGSQEQAASDVAAQGPETTIVDRPMTGQPAMGFGDAADPLFTRTLTDGTVLDVRIDRYGDDTGFVGGACVPTGVVYAGVRAPDSVGQVYGQFHTAITPGVLLVSLAVVGGPEGAPRLVVLAQGADDVVTVRTTFPDGSVDETAVQQHLAALGSGSLAASTSAPVRADEVVVDGLDASGAVVARWVGDRWGGRALPTGTDDVVAEPTLDAGVPPETTVPPGVAEPTDEPAPAPAPEVSPEPIEPAAPAVDLPPDSGAGYSPSCPAP